MVVIHRGGAGIIVTEGAVAVKIPAVHVVNETVVIIVGAVAGDLTGVDENVRRQIGMIHLHAIVDDGDDDVRIAQSDVPGTRQLGVRAGSAIELAGVAQVPLIGEQRIVRGETLAHLHDEIRLGPLDPGKRGEAIHLGENFVRVCAGQREEELIGGAVERPDARPRRAE